jgi:two-component system OmpR family response regulator
VAFGRQFSPMAQPAPPQLQVLVVDDDPDSAESLAFCLQVDGRQVRYATCGDEALRLAETCPPDFALIDIFMPELDGHALAAELRRRFGKDIVVVAVTGALKSVELGHFDFHLMKPINFNQLEALFTGHRGSA